MEKQRDELKSLELKVYRPPLKPRVKQTCFQEERAVKERNNLGGKRARVREKQKAETEFVYQTDIKRNFMFLSWANT